MQLAPLHNGAVFLTGDTQSKSMKYGGTQIMYIDPLAAGSALTQDAAVGFVVKLDAANGTAAWCANGGARAQAKSS
jgi:hypothetical protein